MMTHIKNCWKTLYINKNEFHATPQVSWLRWGEQSEALEGYFVLLE